MEKAVVELDVSHCVVDDSIAILLAMTQKQMRYTVSFRFKDLSQPMQLCRYSGKFFIIFALKHPPRLSLVTGWEDRVRLTNISSSCNGSSSLLGLFGSNSSDNTSLIPGLGSCLGYCLGISEVEVNRMVTAQAFHKLKKMGLFIFEDELDLLHQADLIRKEQVDARRRKNVDTKIASAPSHRMGLHLLSILDAQSCAWFDMLKDKVAGHDIFSLVRDGDDELVERVRYFCSSIPLAY